MYYTITIGEDGDIYFQHMSEAELLDDLAHYEENYMHPPRFMSINPEAHVLMNIRNWPGGTLLIIRGEVVTPKPREKVIAWEL